MEMTQSGNIALSQVKSRNFEHSGGMIGRAKRQGDLNGVLGGTIGNRVWVTPPGVRISPSPPDISWGYIKVCNPFFIEKRSAFVAMPDKPGHQPKKRLRPKPQSRKISGALDQD